MHTEKYPAAELNNIKYTTLHIKKFTRERRSDIQTFIYISLFKYLYYMFRPQQIKYFPQQAPHHSRLPLLPSFFNPYEVSFPYPFFHLSERLLLLLF